MDSWQDARVYELLALTSSKRQDRDEQLALMLYALGHVLHLNQDMSQPEHVRNDQHPTRNAIEKYGKNSYLAEALKPGAVRAQFFPLRPRGWHWRRDIGFRSVEAFWTRDLYPSGPQALNDDAIGAAGKQLGLAEFANGNFLGQDSIYREHFPIGHLHRFPFPSLFSTTYPQILSTPGAGAGITLLRNGVAGTRLYLGKVADGTIVRNHSVLTHTGALFPKRPPTQAMKAMTTVADNNVLAEYHSILIPKAIEYSAGILDYFFRGQVEVICYGLTTDGKYEIRITNKSAQDLKGGSFHLFCDDAEGNRTPLTGANFVIPWSGNSSLADEASIDAVFTPPTGVNAVSYMLVYRGTIGTDANGAALDRVDEGIAVIAKQIHLCCGTGRIVPRYDNTTKVPDWHTPPGSAIDPYARPVDGEGEACGGVNEKPCEPWAEPVPENTFAANGVIELGAPGAQPFHAFKAVQAKKAWHGRLGFDACPSTTTPTTKYRRVRREVVMNETCYTVPSGAPIYGSATYVRDYLVDRYSGVVAEVDHEDPADSGCFAAADDGVVLVNWSKTDYACGRWTNPQYQSVLDSPDVDEFGRILFCGEFTGEFITRSQSSTELVLTYGYDESILDPEEEHPGRITYVVRITLSEPYSGEDCHADLAALLGEWDLADDALYPWRTDEYCTVAPLVSCDEVAGAVDPDSGVTEPNGSPPTGAIRGAPLPAGYRRFFNFRHPNEELREWGVSSGYIAVSKGAWTPNYLPQNATQWTTVGEARRVFLPCAHVRLLETGVMVGMKRADTELSPVAISGAANSTPIVIEVSRPTGLRDGDRVDISGVEGNTAANVTDALVTVVDATHFTLTGTAGNGNYTGGGVVRGQPVFVNGHFWGDDQSLFACVPRRTTGACGVLYFSPAPESFQNGFHGGWFPAPTEPTGREVYSGSIRQFVADDRWTAPHDLCGAGNCRSCQRPLDEIGGALSTCACP
jgi:hypothetical protein